jgi:hypothetical protein
VCNPDGVKLLEAEPVAAPQAAPPPPPEAPPEQPPSKPEAVRTCASCGSPMEADQDWCLNCGTAASGSLGRRPGWRAASTVIALTAVLVLGAIAASYAAITSNDAKKPAPAAAPAAQQQAAATPPATTPPATTPPAASTPTTSTPTTSTPSTSTTLPKVTAPKSTPPASAPVTPTQSTPTTSTPTTSTPTTSTPTTSTPTTTTPTGPQPIELAGDAGKAYDPYGKSKASGEAERAIDGDTSTSWYVDLANPEQAGLGYAIDLGKLQGIREIQLQTPTPGFRIEVYATDETELPPDILDTRWSHITNVSNVGTKDDGKQKIVLGAGTSKYRNLLLWFTKPPTDGARIRLTEVQLLG